MSTVKTGQTTTCKWCGGKYLKSGWCPKFGLKFQNSFCPTSEVIVNYKIVKVRNTNPWWKFWNRYFDEELIIV